MSPSLRRFACLACLAGIGTLALSAPPAWTGEATAAADGIWMLLGGAATMIAIARRRCQWASRRGVAAIAAGWRRPRKPRGRESERPTA